MKNKYGLVKSSIVFVSLKTKLIVGFTLVFTVAFTLSYYWFYAFALTSAMDRITEDLVGTIRGATETGILGVGDRTQVINGDELGALINEVEPGKDGLTDDPRYWHQVETLCNIRRVEPRASLYTYIVGDEEGEIIFITSWGRCLPDVDENIAFFKQSWITDKIGPNVSGLTEITLQDDSLSGCSYASEDCTPKPYTDDFGSWISAFAPIRDSNGEVVAGLGVDFEASYVQDVQKQILYRVLIAFGLTYPVLLLLVYGLAQLFANPITKLTEAAEYAANAEYKAGLNILEENPLNSSFPDEFRILQTVFKSMVEKVFQREKSLRETVEYYIRIRIDEFERQRQVEEITKTEFFQILLKETKRRDSNITNEKNEN